MRDLPAEAAPSQSACIPNFDFIARPYRWFEYLTFGPALHCCRSHYLPDLLHARRALVLGDGDGRFLAHLLAVNPHLQADAVDLSATMLHLLHRRCQDIGAARLSTHLADARSFDPTGSYDLIVTHFFLDCLTQPELDQLTITVQPHLTPGALWVLSDFRIPDGAAHLPARALIRLLYLVFRLLTGLSITHLPDHTRALRRAGFSRIRQRHSLYGILTSELWQRHPSERSQHPIHITAAEEIS